MWSHFNSIKNTSKLDKMEEILRQMNHKDTKAQKLEQVKSIQYNPAKKLFSQTREILKEIGVRS